MKEENIDYNIKINKETLVKEAVSWVFTIIACLIIAKFITSYIIVNARVPSASMENTIMTNDRLIANRLAYIFDDPQRFDVMVFIAPDEPDKLYVKRVIGIPGDTVEIIDGELYINSELIEENYLKDEQMYGFGGFDIDQPYNDGPYYVPEAHYFMLGDNRNNSLDSRDWMNTYVPEESVLGKAVFTYFPSIHLIN